MVVTTVKYKIHQPLVSCDVDAIEAVHNSNTLDFTYPINTLRDRCLTRRIETGTEQCYEFENMCHLKTSKRWQTREQFVVHAWFEFCLMELDYIEAVFQEAYGMKWRNYERKFYIVTYWLRGQLEIEKGQQGFMSFKEFYKYILKGRTMP